MVETSQTLYGTCVAVGKHAALIRGESGTGKSDLAYRFANGSNSNMLVSDDRVAVSVSGDQLIAQAPEAIAGLMELRGVGLVPVQHLESAVLKIVIDLVPMEDVPRMQVPFEADSTVSVLGHELPCVKLYAFEPSAPLKLTELILQASCRSRR